MSNIMDLGCMQGFVRMCTDGWEQGWHERNGGNLSYRMQEDEISAARPFFKATPGEWKQMGVKGENLKNTYFIVTGSGRYMRNVQLAPADNICILEINGTGDAFRIVWGLEKGGRPTSEFESHFMNHSVQVKVTDGATRVIYHAHPGNLIAMTYVLPLTDKAFSRALWQSATECPVVFPQGVGVVPWMVPGGSDIALATCEKMNDYKAVVWAQHGLFCAGADFDETFGLMHTIEKAAEIFIHVLSAGQGKIRQTITDDALRQIAKAFGVTLPEQFLDGSDCRD